MPCGMKASIPRGSCLYTSASPQLPNLRPGCPPASQARCRNHQETWSSLARRRCQPCPCSGPGRLGRPSPSCPGCPSCPGPSSSMTRRAHPEPGTAQFHGVSDLFLPQRSRIIFWEWLFHQNFRWCLLQKKIGKSILKESHGFQRVPEDTGGLPKHSWLATGSKNVPLSYQAMPEYGEERKISPTKKGKTKNMGM